MFITIRFGADEEELFNPDCATRLLVENIRKRCDCEGRDGLALVDEKGGLVNLAEQEKSMDGGAHLFQERGSYILIAQERRGSSYSYIPLIDDPGKDLLLKLESLSGPAKKLKGRNMASRTPLQSTKQPSISSQKAKKR